MENTEYLRVSTDEYLKLTNSIFLALGFSSRESADISDVLMKADLFGVESHGISRIMKYVRLISEGAVDVKAVPEIIHETPISAVYDAHSAMGQLVSKLAINTAIQKAKTSGIGMVQVKNSNHFGIAGYYVLEALRSGFIGICMTNTPAIMVPTFAAEPLLGSNPIAFGFPSKDNPFLFDASTTVITRGKIELYNKLGKEMPFDWAVDENGNINHNPKVVLNSISNKTGGGILPLGGAGEEQSGYKGYGFAYICELLTSVLSGGEFSINKTDKGDTSHAFYVINPDLFGDRENILESASKLANEIHGAKTVLGHDRIFIAGEKEFESEAYNLENGIPISVQTIKELKNIVSELGIE